MLVSTALNAHAIWAAQGMPVVEGIYSGCVVQSTGLNGTRDGAMNERRELPMEVKYKIYIYGDPRGKGRPRFTMKGHAFTDAKTAEYERNVKKVWKSSGCECLAEQPTTIIINAFFRVPSSLSKKKREALFGQPHLHKPDADNIGKILLDALNGLAYADDKQINTLLVNKKYVDSDDDEPRVEITIIGGCE